MEFSVREARAQFATALAAAERGERVTITKNGKPIAELGPPTPKKGGLDWARLERVRRELGIEKPDYPLDEAWRESFDDPAWMREILGPEYYGDEPDGTA
jgi:prevent-host-death family protein